MFGLDASAKTFWHEGWTAQLAFRGIEASRVLVSIQCLVMASAVG